MHAALGRASSARRRRATRRISSRGRAACEAPRSRSSASVASRRSSLSRWMKPVAIVLYCMNDQNSDRPQAKKVSAPKPASILERSDSGVRIFSGAGRWRAATWTQQRPHGRAVPQRLVERDTDGDDDGLAAHQRRVLEVDAEEQRRPGRPAPARRRARRRPWRAPACRGSTARRDRRRARADRRAVG